MSTLEPRAWLPAAPAPGGHLVVLQWNVLARRFCRNDEPCFPYVSDDAVAWEKRRPLFEQALASAGAQLIALEEVDEDDDFFLPWLTSHGYRGRFAQGARPHGLALFVAPELELVTTELVAFQAGGGKQIALLARVRLADRSLVFGVTHLKAKVGHEELRLRQAEELLAALDAFREEDEPVLLAGDFNEVADGPAIRLMLGAQRGLRSAYARFPGADTFTTFKQRDKVVLRTIDYIFYSPAFSVSAVLAPPVVESLPDVGLPSATVPSDHLRLSAAFSLGATP